MNEFVILDGFHAIKHALRFGAVLTDIVSVDRSGWEALAATTPDIAAELERRVRDASEAEFTRVSPRRHPTGIAAVAKRPSYATAAEADACRPTPAILLEDPRRLGNIGAVIRVAAAVGASSVLTTGSVDPWHADAIRGSAGLHFAQPVMRIDSLEMLAGPVIAMAADGEPIASVTLPPHAIVAFGTERDGISDELRARADTIVALPMELGVSSLNLATSVAASLYWWRLGRAF